MLFMKKTKKEDKKYEYVDLGKTQCKDFIILADTKKMYCAVLWNKYKYRKSGSEASYRNEGMPSSVVAFTDKVTEDKFRRVQEC